MSKIKRLLRYDLPLHFVLLITNWLPDNVIFLRLRGWLATPFFGACGKNLRIGRNITFYNSSKMHLANDIYIAYGCWFNAAGEIRIGNEVMFGPYCVIVSSNHSIFDNSYRYGTNDVRDIFVGSGSWIGANVTLTAGSCIGKASLVAAGAVVTNEFSDNLLIGGVPARTIREIGL